MAEHIITFEPESDATAILLKWLVAPRERISVGQQLALYQLPSSPPLGPLSPVSSSSVAASSMPEGPVVLVSDRDALVKEICVSSGDIIFTGQSLLVVKSLPPPSPSSSNTAVSMAPSDQLRRSDTPRYSHQTVQFKHSREISSEISRLSRKRRNLAADLMKKMPDENELLNDSHPIVSRYLLLDTELGARETEKRRELLEIFRALKQRKELTSGPLDATINVAGLSHLCDELPIWAIAPVKYYPTGMDSVNGKTKEIISFDGPDEEERDCEIPGHMLGRVTSTYPWLNSNDEREGDPICDHISARIFENRFFVCIADGCSWGPAPAEAAKRATNTFLKTLVSHHDSFRDTQQIGHCLLDALSAAHDSIMIDQKDIFEAGTTTLLGGVLIQLNKLDEQGQPTWAFVFASVGDCIAEHSLVSIGHGLCRPVQSIRQASTVASWNPSDDLIQSHQSRASHLIRKGLKRCLELRTVDGQTLKLTPEHRVLATLRGRQELSWTPAGELSAHHLLLRQLTIPVIDDPTLDECSDDFALSGKEGWALATHRDELMAFSRLLAILDLAPRDLAIVLQQEVTDECSDIQRDLALAGGLPAVLQLRETCCSVHRFPRFMRREYAAAQLGYFHPPSALIHLIPAGADWVHFARHEGVRYAPLSHLFISVLSLYYSTTSASVLPRQLDNPAYLELFLSCLRSPATHPLSLLAELDPAASPWASFTSRPAFDLRSNSMLVALSCPPQPLPSPLPVYDLSVPVHENFVANSLVVHNCKAFIWSRATRKVSDITESGRGTLLTAKDCGGRIGPYYHTGQPDLRNLSVSVAPCFEGDMLILCSDGVHDNLDPVQLGLAPSDLDLEGENWDDIDPAIVNEAQLRFRCDFLQSRVFGNLANPSPLVVCSRIINHCVDLTTPAREYLEREPESILPVNYTLYPGKMDHTSCLAITVSSLARRREEDNFVPPSPVRKPSMMKTTSARLTTAFRQGPRPSRDKPIPSMLDSSPKPFALLGPSTPRT